MQMVPLSSSALVAAGYEPATRLLMVQFTSGKTYQHHDVPPDVFKGLTEAPSPGRYYHQAIKGKYL